MKHFFSKHPMCSSGLALLVLAAPHTVQAGRRNLDWAAIAERAEVEMAELQDHPCTDGPVDSVETREWAARNLRLAGYYDFTARSVPAKPVGERANRIYALLYKAVPSYERAYACAPGFDNRGALVSAIALIDYAIEDLEAHPSKDEDTVAEYTVRRKRIHEAMPAQPPPERRPQAAAPLDDEKPGPIGEGPRGCSIDPSHREFPGAVTLLALYMGTTSGRRRQRHGSSPRP